MNHALAAGRTRLPTLIREPATSARIRHMLDTGKPLRN